MNRSLCLLASLALTTMACHVSGDNTAVRAFHARVKVGMDLSFVVAEGEKAQRPDIRYAVYGRHCVGDRVEMGRNTGHPFIRVTRAPPAPGLSPDAGYRETGFANREEFAKALGATLPQFYGCTEFEFDFGRYEGWPQSDSFTVTVTPQGAIKSKSRLRADGDD